MGKDIEVFVADAVVDVGEELTVSQRRNELAEGGNARIDVFTDGRVTGPIEIVTDRAFLLERRGPGGDGRFVRLQWIDARHGFSRHAISEQPGRNLHLDRGRCWARARQTGERKAIESAGAKGEHDEKRDDKLPHHFAFKTA